MLLKSNDIIHYNNATTGFTEANRTNESITKVVLYWSFNASKCNMTNTDNIKTCSLFDSPGVFRQMQSYGVLVNYYITPSGEIYKYVDDKNIAWSSGKLNPEVLAIRLGYLNDTWAGYLSNAMNAPDDQFNQPTPKQYRALAKLLATMKLEWNHGIGEIMFYNQININFPDSRFNLECLKEELHPYGLCVNNNNLTSCDP